MKKIIFTALIYVLFITGCNNKDNALTAPLEKLPEDYSLADAKEDGCVVYENGDITFGKEIWDGFVASTGVKGDCSVRYCNYYTIEDASKYAPEYYEEIKDEYPKMYVHDLTWNGEVYTVRWFENSVENVREYKYLMKYEDVPESNSATYSLCTRYVLTNDDTVSWEDISDSMYSSLSMAFIDHLTVYSDYVYKDE